MSPHSTDSGAEWHPSVNPWLIAMAVVLATFLEVLDTTIVSVAQPNMAGNLGATNEEATWVLTSYLVANAIALPASGWLSLRFGRKRFLIACTALFTVGSFLCGLAPSMPFLILARILQGAGGGALLPLSQAILLESFPREKQGMAMAMFGLGVVVAPVLGPFVGGWITDNYSWRWVFNINIPMGILAIYMMARYIEDPPYIKNARPGSVDGIGFGLLAMWLATLQIVLDKGQQEDWFASSWIAWFSVISVAALGALIVRELRTPEPIVDLRVFRDRNFWVGTAVTVILMGAMYSALTMLPLFLQTLLGYTAQSSGVATAPRGLGAMVAMPMVGILMSYVDSRWLMSLGIACVSASTLMFGNLTLEVNMASIVWPNVLQGLGMGLVLVPLLTIAVGTLPKEKIGNGSGIFNLMRNLGGSIGISISTTFLVRMTQVHQSNLVSHMTPYDPVFQQRLAGMTAGLGRYSAGPAARMQAYGVLYGILQQQSNVKAYVDMFCWTALMVALCLPGVWLLKRVVAKKTVAIH
ncbi:MAG: DHA2 family efflux MFS transporter permease subunit [Bryobacteraceae bacterium]|jgi:DHA2 family multidrug resistance protein